MHILIYFLALGCFYPLYAMEKESNHSSQQSLVHKEVLEKDLQQALTSLLPNTSFYNSTPNELSKEQEDLNEELFLAIIHCNTNDIEKALIKGANSNSYFDGKSCLHHAIYTIERISLASIRNNNMHQIILTINSIPKIIALLVSYGANINALDSKGYTALDTAIFLIRFFSPDILLTIVKNLARYGGFLTRFPSNSTPTDQAQLRIVIQKCSKTELYMLVQKWFTHDIKTNSDVDEYLNKFLSDSNVSIQNLTLLLCIAHASSNKNYVKKLLDHPKIKDFPNTVLSILFQAALTHRNAELVMLYLPLMIKRNLITPLDIVKCCQYFQLFECFTPKLSKNSLEKDIYHEGISNLVENFNKISLEKPLEIQNALTDIVYSLSLKISNKQVPTDLEKIFDNSRTIIESLRLFIKAKALLFERSMDYKTRRLTALNLLAMYKNHITTSKLKSNYKNVLMILTSTTFTDKTACREALKVLYPKGFNLILEVPLKEQSFYILLLRTLQSEKPNVETCRLNDETSPIVPLHLLPKDILAVIYDFILSAQNKDSTIH